MRVSTLIEILPAYLNDLLARHGDVDITSLELPCTPVRAALELVLGSDDSGGAVGPVYIITTRTGVAETFDNEEDPTTPRKEPPVP